MLDSCPLHGALSESHAAADTAFLGGFYVESALRSFQIRFVDDLNRQGGDWAPLLTPPPPSPRLEQHCGSFHAAAHKLAGTVSVSNLTSYI
jgi:hypothetical protein